MASIRNKRPQEASPGILIVDDDESIRNLLQVALERQGFQVWLAADGFEAVGVFQSYRTRINLVLLDVRMPVLDGPACLTALREIDPEVRCCFMTGHAGHYTERELEERGAAAVFPKPFSLCDLAHRLWQLAVRMHRGAVDQNQLTAFALAN